jgi:hypothetical protein
MPQIDSLSSVMLFANNENFSNQFWWPPFIRLSWISFFILFPLTDFLAFFGGFAVFGQKDYCCLPYFGCSFIHFPCLLLNF